MTATSQGAGKTRRTAGSHLARAAGASLFAAGAGILMGITTAESLYPRPYGTGTNQISDLGGTEPPHAVVLQPSATIFDVTMVVAGVLIILAALGASRAGLRKAVSVPLALLGCGALGVGIFPGKTGGIHQLFALLTFMSGSIAVVLSYRVLPGAMRYIAAALGAVALVNLVAYTVLQDGWFVTGLGLGGLERWIAYPIVLWLMGFGGYLVGATSHAERTQGERAPAAPDVAL
jgi:hypothetical membrane protein